MERASPGAGLPSVCIQAVAPRSTELVGASHGRRRRPQNQSTPFALPYSANPWKRLVFQFFYHSLAADIGFQDDVAGIALDRPDK